jgi:hypothetical protein
METDGKGIELIQQSARNEAQQLVIGDRTFSTKDLKPVIFDPHPHALGVGTLTGIRDFMAANVDKLAPADLSSSARSTALTRSATATCWRMPRILLSRSATGMTPRPSSSASRRRSSRMR